MMRRFEGRDKGHGMAPLDDLTVEGLLAGTIDAHDVGPELAGTASVLAALRAEPAAAELVGGPQVIAAMERQIVAVSPAPEPRRGLLRKALTAKAAVVAAGVLFTASAAAAATGNLPDSAQQTASDMLSKLGINVPGPNGHAGTHGKSSSNESGTPDTNSSTGPNPQADFGLCTAENASDGHSNATVFPPTSVCNAVTHPGQPQGTGKPANTPTGGTPNHGAASGNSNGAPPTVTVGGGASRNPTNHPSHS